MIKLNPSIEAIAYGETLSLFAGDRVLAFRGKENIQLYTRLKEVFAKPVQKEKLENLAPDIHKLLPSLLDTEILLEEADTGSTTYHGDSILNNALKNNLGSNHAYNLLVCLPDTHGLTVQIEALQNLKNDQNLLTGFYRGSSLFVFPLIEDKKANLLSLALRLLSTEAGTGNLYFSKELEETDIINCKTATLPKEVANWMATDLSALLNNNLLNKETTHIYRGQFVTREDIALTTPTLPINMGQSFEDNKDAIETMFVGQGNLVSRCYNLPSGEEHLWGYVASAEAARTKPFFLHETEDADSWGTGATRSEARFKATMEALERYAISDYNLEDYPLIAQNELSLPFLDRMSITGYGAQDIFPPDIPSDRPRRWQKVKSLSDGKEYFVPLELIRYPVPADSAGYDPVDSITSSGVAAHLSYECALDAACHELIERDAFLIAWLRKACPPLIDLNSLSGLLKEKVKNIHERGWSIKIMNLTADLAPIICVLLSRDSETYRFSLGAASNDDVETACLKAMEEALINFIYFKPEKRSAKEILEKLESPIDHIQLYSTDEYAEELVNFFSSDTYISINEVVQFTGRITDRINKQGMKCFVAEFNHPRIQEKAPNIHVLRVIIPTFVPIHFGPNWRRTGSPRIKTIPETINWKIKSHNNEHQTLPHPFP